MRDISEKLAVELRWSEVCDIVSEEVREILGLHVQCKANVIDLLRKVKPQIEKREIFWNSKKGYRKLSHYHWKILAPA